MNPMVTNITAPGKSNGQEPTPMEGINLINDSADTLANSKAGGHPTHAQPNHLPTTTRDSENTYTQDADTTDNTTLNNTKTPQTTDTTKTRIHNNADNNQEHQGSHSRLVGTGPTPENGGNN